MKTLYAIEVLLRLYYTGENFHPDQINGGKAWCTARDWLHGEGLIETGGAERGRAWEVTERGRVYVEAIRALPLPVCAWIMPASENQKGTER